MPVIFNETNYDKYKTLLLESGIDLIQQGGFKNITVENVTKRVGIAKGTFYTFFPSKEEFIYQISTYNRDKVKKYYSELSNEDGLLGKKEIIEFLTFLFLNENNIYTHLTQEDYAYLCSRWPREYSIHEEADQQTTTWLLNSMKARPDCDWRIVANLMKSITFVTMEKRMLHQDVYNETIILLIKSIADYIFGK